MGKVYIILQKKMAATAAILYITLIIYPILEVGVDAAPLLNCRNNVESNELVTHLAKVLVACVELCNLLGSTDRHLV
jgi:hypothetical protein